VVLGYKIIDWVTKVDNEMVLEGDYLVKALSQVRYIVSSKWISDERQADQPAL
jgi:hypothetical protein